MEGEVCKHCHCPFKKGPKGYNRRSCKLLFPEDTIGFYCLDCFSMLKKCSVPPSSKRNVKRLTGTPSKSPAGKKVRISVSPAKNKCKDLPFTTLNRYFANNQYRPALNILLKKKGFTSTTHKYLHSAVHKELNSFTRKNTTVLRKYATISTLSSFSWEECLQELFVTAPTTMKLLAAMISKSGKESQINVNGVLFPTLGFVAAVILNAREPRKCHLLQSLVSVQMYRCGCPQKLLTVFNKLHVCQGTKATRNRVDALIQQYKDKFQEKKKLMEEFLVKQEGRLNRRGVRRLEFSVEQKDDDGETQVVEPMGYTFCWDNTQIDVKARTQTKDQSVYIKLWALCYAASNRIKTEHLNDQQPHTKATEIPISVFLPGPDYRIELRRWLQVHVKNTLTDHLDCFKQLKEDYLQRLKHDHWREMKQKSEVINLGVLDENPSSTDGVISILDYLTGLVPIKPNGEPYTIITHCDGGAFERMVSARRARAPDRNPAKQLLGIEPSAQEFHKRGIVLQIIMDKFFKSSSQADRGTLSNIKEVMGLKSVKSKVMESFNHVETMFDMVCDGMICLLAMQFLGMKKQDDEPPILQFSSDIRERDEILDDIVESIVGTLWKHPTEKTIALVTDALVGSEHLNLSGSDDAPEEPVICSNAKCPNGGVFHRAEVEIITDEIPDPAEDWWCSPECQGHSKFCICKRHIEGSEMVECNNGQNCDHGMWFHPHCLGFSHLPGASAIWYCPACEPPSDDEDSVQQYSNALLWMLLNDKLRRTAIRTGDGPMLMQFWKDDGIHFWNENHNKYLILMHQMIADTNGWLSERQAADLIWNRTVSIRGGIGRNVAMDKINEFLNNDFKENLKHSNGKYTAAQIQRSSYIAGGVSRDLDNVFASNVGKTRTRQTTGKRTSAHNATVNQFIQEYQDDCLFEHKPGRQHHHFQHFNAKLGEIKKPEELKKRLLKYSLKMDRGRFAAQKKKV